MRLSDNKIIKFLNSLASVILVLYVFFLVIKLFSSGAPTMSNSTRDYQIYDVIAKNKVQDQVSAQALDKWFNNIVVVQPTNQSLIHLRFKSHSELFSFPAILFQISQLIYWLLIGLIIYCIKKLFNSFNKDEVFTKRNATMILFGAITLILLPIIRWITQELFINCIEKLHLNDSGYLLQNGTGLIGSETLVGLALLAFALAFKAGVNMKQENESFI
ncbi:DUF2975 domain-containing protein [Pedobacter foliorum]|uniref:DUF2975 domain-containing protein n=1 Tax=Pedobacter foliorum TaxID=2739058 RepID=UPI001563E376|nr:DUF2975 domain-containing protein [Pedobacter foliorum]NRF38032.1 DUF2975 domain-containing protein [Pedobacter foliorum]